MHVSLARTMLPMPMRHISSSSDSSSSSTSSNSNMLLYGFLGVLCFVRTIESAPLAPSSNGDPESSRIESTETLLSGLQSKKGQEEEVGNPSEIAYQAWLLIDGHPDSHPLGGLDSASLLRRIKPKSIFVAPNLTACPDGYQDDTMNRCVKDVNIDHQAHKGFLVQRLQAIFGSKSHAAAATAAASSSSLPSVATGPLQLNIPLLIAAPAKLATPPPPPSPSPPPPPPPSSSTPSTADSSSKIVNNNSQQHHRDDAIVTVYELNEDESTFFLGNNTSENTQHIDKQASTRPELLAPPVGQYVDDTKSNLSGVVDYKISTPNEKTRDENLTLLVDGTDDEANGGGTYEEDTHRSENSEDTNISPTLVLLLSPTKVPSIPVSSGDLIVAHNSSLGQVIIKMENVTGNDESTKEIIRVSVADAIAASSSSSVTPSVVPTDNVDDSTTVFEEQPQHVAQVEGSSESTEVYYEENYEESTESEDEILKHSEAGMTVTLAAPREKATEYGDKEPPSPPPTRSSEISSEVSISDDFVRETTLVDLNLGKTSNSTNSPGIVDDDDDEVTELPEETTTTTMSDENLRNEKRAPLRKMPIVVLPEEPIGQLAGTTERLDSAETMIASSTNDAGTVVSRLHPKFDVTSLSSSKKRAGQPFGFEAVAATSTTKIPPKPITTLSNVEGVYDYEPIRDYPQRNPYAAPEEDVPVIKTMDHQQRYRPDNEEEDQNFFPLQQQQQQHDYVRFPSYDRYGRPNFVRFPSEEANSINPNDYKERRLYNRYQQQQQQQEPVTKNQSQQDVHQKQSYWWLPPGWRMDKQQQEAEQRSRSGTDRSRTPMLLRFWTRMPLVRDPSLNYQHPTYPTVGQRDPVQLPRRVNYYKEMSTHDFNRAFARKSRPSAIDG